MRRIGLYASSRQLVSVVALHFVHELFTMTHNFSIGSEVYLDLDHRRASIPCFCVSLRNILESYSINGPVSALMLVLQTSPAYDSV